MVTSISVETSDFDSVEFGDYITGNAIDLT